MRVMNPRSDGFSVKVKPVVKPASTVVYVEAGLSEGYEHEPVPKHARKSLFTVSAVWIGFPMVVTSVVVAGIVVYNLGFVTATMALPVGNAVLLVTWGR
jgi:purine-cytosine permease-like protein